MIRAFIVAIWLVAFWGVEVQSQGPPPEPPGYRIEDYRAPTPATLAGARVVTTKEAEDLWKTGVAFVDVLPRIPRPANLPPGTIWHEKVRTSSD